MDSVNEVVIKRKRSRLGQYWAVMGYIFQIIRDIDPQLKILIDTFTLLGLVWSLKTFYTLFALSLSGFRVHVWSRVWSLDLKKKYGEWVLITGATDGLGLEYARQFARRGHSLILVGRNDSKLANVKTQLSSLISSNKIITVRLDMDKAQPEDYVRVAREISANEREIGILINNAGVMYSSPNKFLDQSDEETWAQVRVNALALVAVTRLVLPSMVSRKRGLVINLSSIAAYQPLPLMGVYSASKAFVEWFSKTLQYEYASNGIDVQILIPSYIATKMTKFSNFLQQPSITVPSPESFVKNAIATIGRSNFTTGYWSHGIQYFMYDWLTPSWLYSLSSWFLLKTIDSSKKKS